MADIVPCESDLTEDSSAYTTEFAPRSLNIAPRSHRMTYPNSLMKTTLSSPNLLNEISEENESDFEDSPKASPRNSRRPLRRSQQKYDKKRTGCRLSPIHSRRSSCSSSDDEELQKFDRRLNIQVDVTRILPHVPENSGGDKEQGSKDCNEGKKNTSILFGDEKENNLNFLNLANLPQKIYVTSVNGRVRNLSDTNLMMYQAKYGFALLKATKCRSDTSLSTSVIGKKALLEKDGKITIELKPLQFIPRKTSFSHEKPIEEENPSDISPVDDKGNALANSYGIANDGDKLTNVVKIANDSKFSSIQDNEDHEVEMVLRANSGLRREFVQSRTSSKSSLKYVFNDMPSTDENNCYTIEESRSAESVKESTSTQTESLPISNNDRRLDLNTNNDVDSSNVAEIGHVRLGHPTVRSKYCNIV